MNRDVTFRPARREDARAIAEMFRVCTGGVADYAWRSLAAPGQSVLEVGVECCARPDTPFSYENCVLAEADGGVTGMLHAYVVADDAVAGPTEDIIDPVLRPFSELELPGSYYLAGSAVHADYRNRGIGSAFLDLARRTAAGRGIAHLSVQVFEQNSASLRLLARNGFAVVDWRPVVPHDLIRYRGSVLLLAATV